MQARGIVKDEAQKNPFFVFLLGGGDFEFIRSACSLGIPLENTEISWNRRFLQTSLVDPLVFTMPLVCTRLIEGSFDKRILIDLPAPFACPHPTPHPFHNPPFPLIFQSQTTLPSPPESDPKPLPQGPPSKLTPFCENYPQYNQRYLEYLIHGPFLNKGVPKMPTLLLLIC